MSRAKSTGKHNPSENGGYSQQQNASVGVSKTSVGPDQHARIQAAAIQLQKREREQELQAQSAARRGRNENESNKQKTASVFTLQPAVLKEASPALKWASKYDKDAIKEAYLADSTAGRGHTAQSTTHTNGFSKSEDTLTPAHAASSTDRDLPPAPSTRDAPATPSKAAPPAPETEDPVMLEKAAAAALPLDAHPIERVPVPSAPSESQAQPPRISTEHSGSSPESKKHQKLKKKEVAGSTGGFRKMFGRKKGEAKAPETAPEPSHGNTLQPTNTTSLTRRFSGFRKKSPSSTPAEGTSTLTSQAPISEDDVTPVASPHPDQGPSYDPSINSLSRVDSNEAREAHQEFSRFDQGPLEDVPAFVPQESPRESEDAAMPPPISKKREVVPEPPAPQETAPQSPTDGPRSARRLLIAPPPDRARSRAIQLAA